MFKAFIFLNNLNLKKTHVSIRNIRWVSKMEVAKAVKLRDWSIVINLNIKL